MARGSVLAPSGEIVLVNDQLEPKLEVVAEKTGRKVVKTYRLMAGMTAVIRDV